MDDVMYHIMDARAHFDFDAASIYESCASLDEAFLSLPDWPHDSVVVRQVGNRLVDIVACTETEVVVIEESAKIDGEGA